MFDVLVVLILLSLILALEIKDYKIKTTRKREREEERKIVQKIKANYYKNDLDAEFGKKYNIMIGDWKFVIDIEDRDKKLMRNLYED